MATTTRYPLDNGTIFRGSTWLLNNTNANEYVYVMFDANQSNIYWVEMTRDELMHNTSLCKWIRLGQFLLTLDAFETCFYP